MNVEKLKQHFKNKKNVRFHEHSDRLLVCYITEKDNTSVAIGLTFYR